MRVTGNSRPFRHVVITNALLVPSLFAVMTTQPARRRHWVRTTLITLLVAVNGAVLAAYILLNSVENKIDDLVRTVPSVAGVLDTVPPESTDPLTFLLIGSDTREGLTDFTNIGKFDGARSDVIMLIKVYPQTDKAQIVSIPRDLWVDIPGHGRDRINAAYSEGGAALTIETVRDLAQVPINHYVEVDFVGFQSLVDAMDGVELEFPFPARDKKTGLNVKAGTQTLDGKEALAYARSRRYQEKRGGKWRSVDADDLGRTRRQQQLILAILSQLKRPSNLGDAGEAVTAFAPFLGIDPNLAETSLVRLAFSLRGIDANQVETATVSGNPTTVDGKSVLKIIQPETDKLFARLDRGDPLLPAKKGSLRLEVLNGNGREGAAGDMADKLREGGFKVLRVGDSDGDFVDTTVVVRPGRSVWGQLVIDFLGFGSITTGVVDERFDAMVIVGHDGV